MLAEVIDIPEAAAISGIKERSLRNYCERGLIICRRTPSGMWLTTREEANRLRDHGSPVKMGRPPSVPRA